MTDSRLRMNIGRTALVAGVSLAVLYVLCWLGAQISLGQPTHAFVALFTTAPVQSLTALTAGLWALLFGIVAGSVFALVANVLGGFATDR